MNGPYIQSKRLEIYQKYAHQLVELGGAHYCFCNQDDENDHDPCRELSIETARKMIAEGKSYVIRQTIPSGNTTFYDEVYGEITVDNNTLDEGVLLKSDGNEYLSSTPKYNLIYQAFNWEIPTYIHVPPVMKDEQHKLSKRNGDASYQDLVKQGYLSEAIINYLALLGWAPEGEEEIFS